MALPTPVNGQITDAVTQANITVLGNAPANTALGMLTAFAQSMAASGQNAVSAQAQLDLSSQLATNAFIAKLFG
jgi:hypothetical protein